MARDPQNLHGPALLSQCPQDGPQHPQPSLFALSLLRSYKGLTVGDQTKATSILLSSQLPRRLCCRTVSASKELYLAAAVATHEHSWSPLFSTTTPAPPSVCSRDTLASKIHPYYFDCLRHLHQGLQNILAPVTPAFLIRPLPHLPLGNLSPVVSPGSPLHLSYRHRAAASCLSATVSSPASFRTASVGVLLSIPDIILAALSWVRSSLSLLVLEIQGPHAGAAYSSNLP